MLQTLTTELKFAIRALRRSSLFTVIAVASLALGLGANTAIFSLLDQVLLRPAAVRNPGALVMLDSPGPNMGRVYGASTFAFPMYRSLRDHNQVFSGLLARSPAPVTVMQRDGQGLKVDSELVSGNYFEVLGVGAAVGRVLTAADDVTPGASPVAVLSNEFWRNHYAADPGVVGTTIRLNGHPFTVIGVAQQGFRGLDMGYVAVLFAPLTMKAQITPTYDGLNDPRTFFLNLFGRLRPGLTPQSAQSALKPYYRALLEEDFRTMPAGGPPSFEKRYLDKQLLLLDGSGGIASARRDASTPILILMAMAALVLLIACANVANLLMARAAARQKEIAVRLALGAGRIQLIRQLLVESTLLALAGGVAGLLLASWTLELLRNMLGAFPGAASVNWQLDARSLAFLFAVALVCGVLFGLLPALQATRPDLAPSLKDAGAHSATRPALRSKRVLVVAQVALSLILLVGSGLFARSLANLQAVDPGFHPQHLITFNVDAPLSGYPLDRAPLVYAALRERFASLPGVSAAAVAQNALMSGAVWQMTVSVQGYNSKDGEDMNPEVNSVSERFFATAGIALTQGREFAASDTAAAPSVAIVNEAFAKYFFGRANPLGRRIGFGRDLPGVEITGVVRDGQTSSLRDELRRRIYLPVRQGPEVGQVAFYVRTVNEPGPMIQTLRRETAAAYPGLAFFEPKTLETQISESLTPERLVAALCAAFGGLATLLASLGLYGVMAWSVARRTRELGIRSALGAGRGRILNMVLKEVAILAALGIAIGLGAALGLTRLVRAQLFGLTPNDPLTLAAAMAVLFVIALLAGALPASRASRVDPLVALRYE